MVNFEYKYIYLKLGENAYKQVMISDIDFNYVDLYNESAWDSGSTFAGNGTLAFNDLNTISLNNNRVNVNMYDTIIPIYTRGNGLDYVDTSYKLFISYNGIEDGVRQYNSVILYKGNAIVQRYDLGNGNFNIFFASNYNSNRQLQTLRLVTYDIDNNHYVARAKVDEIFRQYLNDIASTNPDKRYYDYEQPQTEITQHLKSTNFIVSDIPSLEQIVPDANWRAVNGYLKDDNQSSWIVTTVGNQSETLAHFNVQRNRFTQFYNSGPKPKLGSNILYYHEGYWETGLRNYSDSYAPTRGSDYNIVSGRLRIYVKFGENENTDGVIRFYVDGTLRDEMAFKVPSVHEYGTGTTYNWGTNHKTDSLFLGKGNYGDYYLFGRTTSTGTYTDGDGTNVSYPAYVTTFKKLSSYTRDVLNEQLEEDIPGEAIGYENIGSELAGNNTSERGLDSEGNEGTWVDTDNDGVVDTFVSDRFKTGAGARGDNDGNKDLADGDGDVADPTLPIGNPASSKLVNVFALTQTELNTFSDELMTPTAWRKMKDFFSVNPLDGVYSLHLLPYTVTTSTAKKVQIGDWKSTENYPPALSPYKIMDFGTVTIKETYPTMEFLNYTDVSVKIFLPLIGFKEVDTSLVIGVPTNLKYYCNILTGDILAVLMCDDKPLYNWIGNCMMKIPLSKNDYSQAISGAIGTVTSLGTSAVGFATKNPMLGVSGLVSAGDSFVKATKPDVMVSGTLSGNASMFTSKQPFFIVSRNTLAYDKEFNHDFGRHTYKKKTIGDNNIKGFTKIVDIDLDNLTCTEQEKDEIRNLLKDGIYV